MKAATYNKSEIMRQAWNMYRSKFYGYTTFSEALKMAWYYAKQEVECIKQVEARKAEQAAADASRMSSKVETRQDKFYNSFNRRNNAAYRNVRFGRNDWAVDYRRY